MSTYNNQWVLGRSRARWRRRAPAAGSGDLERPTTPLAQEPHERQPSGTHERPQPALTRPVRKRPVRKHPRWHPRWIDRDT
jgi:hypothetical protein